jgi:hypothetical protein
MVKDPLRLWLDAASTAIRTGALPVDSPVVGRHCRCAEFLYRPRVAPLVVEADRSPIAHACERMAGHASQSKKKSSTSGVAGV